MDGWRMYTRHMTTNVEYYIKLLSPGLGEVVLVGCTEEIRDRKREARNKVHVISCVQLKTDRSVSERAIELGLAVIVEGVAVEAGMLAKTTAF